MAFLDHNLPGYPAMTNIHRHKRILVSWYITPEYIPPFDLSDHQITVGPQGDPDQPKMMFAGWTPLGEYDLRAALESQNLRTKFDAVVVWSDAGGSNRPLNLSAFDCPKVLCVGDTHHMDRPIRTMIDYAKKAGFDFIVSSHNRHHLHWFAEAGFANVAWIPGIKVHHFPRPIRDGRESQVCFVGQWKNFHPRRQRLLEALRDNGLPTKAGRLARKESAELYSKSVASFNASLNGDLNLRVFEVLSAGGCLLTDRLSSQSGFDLILREDKDYCAYGSAEELVDKARFLLREPATALDIARAGHRTYTQTLLPQRQAAVLLDWIFSGRIDSNYAIAPTCEQPRDALSFKLRLGIYEILQEAHRRLERPRVFIAATLPSVIRDDAADLYRLDVTAGDPSALSTNDWDCIVVPKGTMLPRNIEPKVLISV